MCGWFFFFTPGSSSKPSLSPWMVLDRCADRKSRLKKTLSAVRTAAAARGGRIFGAGALRRTTSKHNNAEGRRRTEHQKKKRKVESAQIHTSVPSADELTVDHKTTFEMDSPAWPHLRSETGPSGGKTAPTPRRPFVLNLLQSPRPRGANKTPRKC